MGEDAWTAERRWARDFGCSSSAIRHAAAKRFEDTEVVLDFGDPRLDLTLSPWPQRGQRGGQAFE